MLTIFSADSVVLSHLMLVLRTAKVLIQSWNLNHTYAQKVLSPVSTAWMPSRVKTVPKYVHIN